MTKINQQWHRLFFAFFLLGTMGFVQKAFADPEFKAAKYLQELRMGGDFRLRFDHEHYQKATADRSRFRMRLRVNTDFIFPHNLAIKTTFASGTGEATSTNQTFTGLSSQKALWIDKAYLEWSPVSSLKLQGGRMPLPLWNQYTSDALWDGDVNPEGFSQNFSTLLGSNFNVFFNALQAVSVERSGNVHDGYVFSEQLGTEVRMPAETRLKIAVAYHDWRNTGQGTFGQNKVQEGNRRAAGVLVSSFGVTELTTELSGWVFKLPLSLQGTFIKNNRVRDAYVEKGDSGYQTGAILGRAKEAKTWEVAYFYKYLEGDATVSDVSDSDFGAGGTNRRGHIAWVAFSPTEWLNVKAKYFATQNITSAATFGTPAGDINRIQLDTVVKF
jgi:Putative porin